MNAISLESERLYYRQLNSSFASQDYVKWMNDEKVIRFLESGGDYNMTKLRDFLVNVEKRDIFFWAILTKDGEKHIGNIKIDPIHVRNKVGEYGILIGDQNEWGKGYAREASNRILDYCFSEKVGLRKITLGVVEDNVNAYNMYLKIGFSQEGLLRSHAFHNGKWCNVVRMAKFNPEVKC